MQRDGLRAGAFVLAAIGIVIAYLPSTSGAEASAPKTSPGTKSRPARKFPARRAAGNDAVSVDLGTASWPQFLGPRRDNISAETGLLGKWPAGGPPLVAALQGLGQGFSNVAIADGVVYTMGNRNEREYVFAIALDRGEKLWEYDNAPAYRNGYGNGPRGTPTIDGDFVYALGATGELVCLARQDGRMVWKKSLVREFGTVIPNWGICESVLIDGDRLICTPGGKGTTMVALLKQSGALVWTSASPQGDAPAYASAIVAEPGGVRQYVNYTATGVIGVRADDGRFLWRDDSSANGTANCCAPVATDALVFTSSGYGRGSSLLSLTAGGQSTSARLEYHTHDLKVQHGGLVLLDGHVYGSNDNNLMCLELRTGKVKWRDRSVGKGSLTCVDGRLIVRSEQGPVALVAASPAAYRELGRFSPKDRSSSQAWTYPVVCGGKLFLRDQDLLQVYDIGEK